MRVRGYSGITWNAKNCSRLPTTKDYRPTKKGLRKDFLRTHGTSLQV